MFCVRLACLIIFLFCVGVAAIAQQPADIPIGKSFSIRSRILNEQREYWVALPQSYYDGRWGKHAYPVLYLLDGEKYFQTATGMIRLMSDPESLQVPEMIIVAIPNTDRLRDLTPTRSRTGGHGQDVPAFAGSGGGDKFVQFITDEIFPRIDSAYRTNGYRILVGHSIGGLLALHVLVQAPSMFSAYLAQDPSLWWDKRTLVAQAARALKAPARPTAVYISSAARTDSIVDDTEIMDPPIRDFARLLDGARTKGIRSRYQRFDGEDHISVPLIGLYEGLRFVFEGYKPFVRDVYSGASAVKAHFRRVSQQLGTEFPSPEPFVEQLGDEAMNRNDHSLAIDFYLLNTRNYPESFRAFEKLGDAYRLKGETKLAVTSYERSLTLNPDNKDAIRHLSELRAKVR